MKKLIVILALLLLATPVMAEGESSIDLGDQLEKLPVLKQGFGYSFLDNDIKYLSTMEILNWKGIALEGGLLWKRFEGHETDTPNILCAVVSYELLKLKDLGVTIPILDLLECRIGVYGGFGRMALGWGNAKENDEFDVGLSVSLISLKF